jgi:hypothetical protein
MSDATYICFFALEKVIGLRIGDTVSPPPWPVRFGSNLFRLLLLPEKIGVNPFLGP